MTEEMAVTGAINLAEKSWKYKLERVSKGYIRPTVHGDDLEQLYKDWKDIHEFLESIGEVVEKVKDIEEAELAKLALKNGSKSTKKEVKAE